MNSFISLSYSCCLQISVDAGKTVHVYAEADDVDVSTPLSLVSTFWSKRQDGWLPVYAVRRRDGMKFGPLKIGLGDLLKHPDVKGQDVIQLETEEEYLTRLETEDGITRESKPDDAIQAQNASANPYVWGHVQGKRSRKGNVGFKVKSVAHLDISCVVGQNIVTFEKPEDRPNLLNKMLLDHGATDTLPAV